ncbi:hypothetical protein EHQ12_09480 [Leptospira gomenensis]|uniref:Uncharacterized protein n=1 Tax=Leptospira gomenensis TaxID=2484974 RepID=A0A5F1YXR6_9LEPT|nr:hypothetical protein EHQ17_01545 [Leptospira gomenensis]TGK39329.1 hypothetical protein EHQ12_09480 [Leptospira gomenensis]TGK52261.1 hypothetical protein EHQ07_00970 [Leptospira gomenensis]TGK63010.1 hypothetical protein EHQ13_08015 [Leptospira gomenensis]
MGICGVYLLILSLLDCFQNRRRFDFQEAPIRSVIFRDRKFEIMKRLDAESEVVEFKNALSLLETDSETEQMPSDPAWTHKIDIRSDENSYEGRWLYSTKTGLLAKLNYSLSPKFHFKDTKPFHDYLRRLGIFQ